MWFTLRPLWLRTYTRAVPNSAPSTAACVALANMNPEQSWNMDHDISPDSLAQSLDRWASSGMLFPPETSALPAPLTTPLRPFMPATSPPCGGLGCFCLELLGLHGGIAGPGFRALLPVEPFAKVRNEPGAGCHPNFGPKTASPPRSYKYSLTTASGFRAVSKMVLKPGSVIVICCTCCIADRT